MRKILMVLIGLALMLAHVPPAQANAIFPAKMGHRCHHGAAENTISALENVDDFMRRPACEIDTWRLSDGTFVVVHDNTRGRTIDPDTVPPGTPTNWNQMTWGQVSQMRTYSGDPVPKLSAFLDRADELDVFVLVELKNALPVDILSEHDAYAYVQTRPTSYAPSNCNSQMFDSAEQAGITIGVKAYGDCPRSVKWLKTLGVSFAVQTSYNLLADNHRLTKRMRRADITPVAMFVGKRTVERKLARLNISQIVLRKR